MSSNEQTKHEDAQKLIAQQLMGQQLQQIDQQLATLDMQSEELNQLIESLEELKKHDKKSIYTPMGAGVFIESELKKPEDLLLNVGSNVIVKKDTESAIKIIKNQVEELSKIKSQMKQEYEKLINTFKDLK